MKSDEKSLSRRTFLKACGAAGVAAAVGGVSLSAPADKAVAASGPMKSVRTVCAPNCTGCCGMKAQVRDNAIQTILPAADYPETEHNPRGCAKGASMTNLIYGPDRLKNPMLRVAGSKMGQFKFEEVSWKDALDHAAGELRRIMDTYGPDSVGYFVQVAGTGYVHKGALVRLANLNGWSVQGGYDMNGDLPMHAPMTFGVQSEELESYQWLDSKYIMIFGSNVYSTRTPDAPMLKLAQEKGTKVIYFDPNFCATSAEADEWYPIKLSSDAAVALGMVKVLLDEKRYNEDYIKTFTDLPILVRKDTQTRLKASDVDGLKIPFDVPEYREAYVVYSPSQGFIAVNPESLHLPDDILLEGSCSVRLTDGSWIDAKPAFQLLKESVEKYNPDKVEELSGMPANDLTRLARELSAPENQPFHLIYGASNYQWYHGDLKGRALALLPVLTGNLGYQGGGFSTLAGQYKVRLPLASWWVPQEMDGFKPPGQKSCPFAYIANGPTETMTAPYPKKGIKAWIMLCGNPFDQHNLNNKLREKVEKNEIELVINLDFQKTTSSNYSHVLLPGVSWYEKTELTATPLHPYLQLMQPAIDPIGECKPELWIFRELAKRLDRRQEKYFYPEYAEEPEKAVAEIIKLILKNGGAITEGITLEQLREGPVKMKNTSKNSVDGKKIPFYEQIHERKPFPPQSFPEPIARTAQFLKSGRIQFYRDERPFIQLNEQLPIHKEPFEDTEYKIKPAARREFPYAYITTNSIHRIHSTHSNNLVFRELQDDRAKVKMNPQDAKEKRIKDGDYVKVFNDRGEVYGDVVLDPGIQAGSIIFEQGWWSRYTGGSSYNSLIYPFINPTHEVYHVPQMWSPNTSWNECLCDVRKVARK
ncbi:MAG: molybdopterin-dependent oxidoreductase [Peptococcaceae bacterium]|nr:molybdopterin-dependent oxidoreductase [Peptococcaceae bacterium]